MAAKSAVAELGFPNAETLRAIADAAVELADVIAKSVVTDDPVHSILEKHANDLPVEPVLDKLESLVYVDPPGLAIVAEKVANQNVPWLTQPWPAGWLDHYAVQQASHRLWGTVAGLLVYFGRDPLSLGTWDRIDGKFVRRVMDYVDHPPIRSEVIGEDGSVRRTDEGLSTAWLGRLRQHAHELREALPRLIKPKTTEAAADDSGKPDTIVTTRNSMRRLSNGWRFDWQDNEGTEGDEVDDLKGFDYIAQLIGTPHVTIPTVRLVGIESDPIALSDKRHPQKAWDSEAERDVGVREAELDATVTRLDNECNEAKAEGDEVAFRDSLTQREQAWNELQEIRRAKAGAIKPNGQPRELNKPNAKDHENIRGAIRRAVKHLDDKQLKRLALHFDAFAKPDGTGTGYVYCPVPTVTWNVEKATPTV